MTHNKENLQERLNQLINEEITGIFFHPASENEDYLRLGGNTIESYKPYGFFIQTKTGKWFTIYETDYSSNSGFAGLAIRSFEHTEVIKLDIGKNQIDTDYWKSYQNSKIESIEIYEDQYSNKFFNGTVPVGFSVHFSNKKTLFILNLTVESVNEKTNSLNFSRGGELLILFNEGKFKELGINKFNNV